jgi:protein-S-isoprenylcysteine O-methyltransferase Ste14
MERTSVILKIIGIFAVFGFVHSLCVRDYIKRLVQDLLGETFMKAFYRLFYTLFSAATTLIAFGFIYALPDVPLLMSPVWLKVPMRLLQFSGLLLALMAFRVLDFLEFTGIKQAWRFTTGQELIGDREGLTLARLVTHGAYGIVRHPLYVAGLLIFTFDPDPARNRLVVSVLADIYFIYGALSEEKRLISHFGSEYEEYMKKVPRFLPRFKKPVR